MALPALLVLLGCCVDVIEDLLSFTIGKSSKEVSGGGGGGDASISSRMARVSSKMFLSS